jgi:hypothetical protein
MTGIKVDPSLYTHIQDPKERKRVYLKEYSRLYESKIKEYRKSYREDPVNKNRKKNMKNGYTPKRS